MAIGHVTQDRTDDGFTLGGTVTYGSLTALRLGLRPSIVTSARKDLHSSLPGIQVHAIPSDETITFHNTYERGVRAQRLESVASSIRPSDVPPGWRSSPLVLLGPLAAEVSFELARHFPNALEVASIQGWLRRWDSDGRVSARAWRGLEVLPYVDAAMVSVEDFQNESLVDGWAEVTAVLIVTMGERGASLHARGERHAIPAFAADEVDPTGAGDVFAAAYLVRYGETGNVLDAAHFASSAASLSVEGIGVSSVPTRTQVEERLKVRPPTS